MKYIFNLMAVLSIAIISISCTPDELPEQGFEGTWELIEVGGFQAPPFSITAEELGKKEYYTFNLNGTFTKTSEETELDSHGSGTFTTTIPDPAEGVQNTKFILDLTFDKNLSSVFVYGCNSIPGDTRINYEELTERLFLANDGKLTNLGCYLYTGLHYPWNVYSKK